MTTNATRIRQPLSLVTFDSCYYLLLKKLNWFIFWLILYITKLVSTLRIVRSGNGMVIIIVMPILSHGNNKNVSQIFTE